MKSIIKECGIGLFIAGISFNVHANDLILDDSLYMGCFNESDAMAANIAAGVGNISVVKEYMADELCAPLTGREGSSVKLKMINKKQVPFGNEYRPMYEIRTVDNGGVSPFSLFIVDIMNSFKVR